jgi:hypothetical protein
MFIMIGFFVLLTHILILSMAFSNRHLVAVVTQPLSYAIKTKIEFLILNCLVEFSNGTVVGAVAPNDFTFHHEDTNRELEPDIGSIRETNPESSLKQAEVRDSIKRKTAKTGPGERQIDGVGISPIVKSTISSEISGTMAPDGSVAEEQRWMDLEQQYLGR